MATWKFPFLFQEVFRGNFLLVEGRVRGMDSVAHAPLDRQYAVDVNVYLTRLDLVCSFFNETDQ
jgi:hypothetical protein